MRKIIVLSFITLDGVVQGPGRPEEDTTGGFTLGGWVAPYADESTAELMRKQMEPADLLLGRKTYEIFASYWPQHAANWPGINDVKKYVLSSTLKKSEWQNTVILENPSAIEELKHSAGGDLKVWGSSKLVQLLLQNGLVDELWLNIYPVLLGKGKKLFGNEAVPASFTLSEKLVTTNGVIIAHYIRSGEVATGTIGA
jgi:dihydrofolate reductase